MNRLSTSDRVAVVASLIEGNSIASTVRMTGISKPTILKLIADLGVACREFHDSRVVDLTTKRIECDELWAFVHAKAKNVPANKQGEGHGDAWTWTAIDADSKLMINWHISSRRNKGEAIGFLSGVAYRLLNRIQPTTDGLGAYNEAIRQNFGDDIDHAVIHKIFAGTPSGNGRYSPPEVTGVEKIVWVGQPDLSKVSTSCVERSNLTVRMGVRRYTRLTNAFSKKLVNHEHMTTIFFTYYNWCRKHMSLNGNRPVMAAGLTDRVWRIEDLLAVTLSKV